MTTDERIERLTGIVESLSSNAVESRIDRVEANLLTLTQGQIVWQKDIRTAMDGLIEAHTLAQRKMETLMDSISKYVDASSEFVVESKARTKRLEENLVEHSNGKKQ